MAGVFTIPSDADFVETLAAGLWRQAKEEPLRLAATTVFLPTRRACRALREAFVRINKGRAALLPRMKPLGDAQDGDAETSVLFSENNVLPAIDPLRRQMLLTRLVMAKDAHVPLDRASELAAALAALLDQFQREEKEWSALRSVVPERYAAHWQETLRFLDIVTEKWPDILAQEGCLDPAARRVLVLDALCDSWRAAPPSACVIVAGSTGSEDAVGRLMAVVAGLNDGAVVLPGFDLETARDVWDELDETHPQYAMKRWLEKSSFTFANVSLWPGCACGAFGRRTLLRRAMLPASATDRWRDLSDGALDEEALRGLEKVELDHTREEAEVIALRMREALQTPEKTVALVTQDRALARRVAGGLGRWGIEVDDSAGAPLHTLSLGRFLQAVLDAASPKAGPVDYLALLKHPLTLFGEDRACVLERARRAETLVWRGVRLSGGARGAALALSGKDESLGAWLHALADVFASVTGFAKEERISVVERLDAHIGAAETLAAGEGQDGAARLWRGAAGVATACWLEDLRAACVDFPSVTFEEYTRLIRSLMKDVAVRPVYGTHPRAHILGPLEARLLRYDVTILGGLNEKTWPPSSSVDPWLSRPMKRDIDLSLPESRIGLSAHDFVFLASGPCVLLTRARRAGGADAVPSRFLLRLGAVLEASGLKDLAAATPWRQWAAALQAPASYQPMKRPSPRPPLYARPKRLSVTEIGVWQRNPYALYAKRVLGLFKVEDLDADVSAADKGEAVHKALELFLNITREIWPAEPLALLLEEGRKAFAPFKDRPQIEAFWWPRFTRLAERFVAEETVRRAQGFKPYRVEAKGELALLNAFVLSGRADRIDRMPDGRVELIDYKTGALPPPSLMYAGLDPQLPLLALLAREGGFDGVPLVPGGLGYWEMKGGKKDDKRQTFSLEEIPDLVDKARAGLEALILTFAREETPYEATPKPRYAMAYDDYAHLARYAEWSREDGA